MNVAFIELLSEPCCYSQPSVYLRPVRSRRSSYLRHSNGRLARTHATSILDRSKECSYALRMYVRSRDIGTAGVDRTERGKIRDGQLSLGYQCFVCMLRSEMMG